MARAKKVVTGIESKEMDHLKKFYERKGEYSVMPLMLVGTTPLLMHAWGQKALMEMLSKMTGHDMPQQDKDLQEDYEQAFYRNVKGANVLPCRILKRCFLDGALATKKAVFKTDLGRYLRVMGQTTVIVGEPRMDVRITRVGGQNKAPNVCARPIFDEWEVKIVVKFAHEFITADKVLLSIESAGEAVGLCEWRPSSKAPGEMGCFRVEHLPVTEVDKILKDCREPERIPEIPTAFLRAANGKPMPDQAKNIVAAAGRRVNGKHAQA